MATECCPDIRDVLGVSLVENDHATGADPAGSGSRDGPEDGRITLESDQSLTLSQAVKDCIMQMDLNATVRKSPHLRQAFFTTSLEHDWAQELQYIEIFS